MTIKKQLIITRVNKSIIKISKEICLIEYYFGNVLSLNFIIQKLCNLYSK